MQDINYKRQSLNRVGWLILGVLVTATPNINASQGLVWIHDNDPSAGSPTETLLRLLLPLDDRVCVTSRNKARLPRTKVAVRKTHQTIQSVVATGGVYKGQGRNQGGLMNHPY